MSCIWGVVLSTGLLICLAANARICHSVLSLNITNTVNDSIVGDGPSSGAVPAPVACYESRHFPHYSEMWKRVEVLGSSHQERQYSVNTQRWPDRWAEQWVPVVCVL